MSAILKFLNDNMLVLLILGGGGFLVWKLNSKGLLGTLKDLLFGSGESTKDKVKAKPFEELPVEKGVLTISDSQAKRYAETLLVAMDKMGTDKNSINVVYSAIKDDLNAVRKVFNAFGKVVYFPDYVPTLLKPAVLISGGGSNMNLRGWLNQELKGDDLAKWNKLLASVGV